MDIQLKQRLTGAIVLVVLAVLILPELLTGPAPPPKPAPTGGDAAPVRSYTIDLTGAAPPKATQDAATLAAPAATTPMPAPTAPQSPAVPEPEKPDLTQGFAVQLGSYANRDTVVKLTRELRAAGFKVSVAPVRAGGKELQRVRVGPVANRAAAEALQQRLSAAGHSGPVVPFP